MPAFGPGSPTIQGPYYYYPAGGLVPWGNQDNQSWQLTGPLVGTVTVTAQADPQTQGPDTLNTNFSIACVGLGVGNVTTADGDPVAYFTHTTVYATFSNDGDATIQNYYVYLSYITVP